MRLLLIFPYYLYAIFSVWFFISLYILLILRLRFCVTTNLHHLSPHLGSQASVKLTLL